MSIIDAFNNYFEMIPANTDELKQEVYKLRYQVYCVENKFLEPDANGVEHDEYDHHSSHYLIRHRETNCYMATTRLVLPDKQNLQKLFPIEVYSQIDNMALLKTMRRANIAELSRFCVSKQFRRRANEQGLLVTNDEDESRFSRREKDSSAHLTLALFACAIKMSAEHNIHYWYAIIDPALKRVVSTLGIHVVEMGPLVDYHGMRLPCAIKIDDLLNDVAEKNLEYWRMLTNNGQY
ncbi:MAG: PEP-CTERM/exosortase system-associated acyltransferase [Methylococcaceae bacterium]|nr:PEP-CTERM/exosortase system-associated acyltransferase [Methylococcaceae bacterium]